MTKTIRELNNDELEGVAGGKLKIGVPINVRLQAIVDDAKKNGLTLQQALDTCKSDVERTFVLKHWNPNKLTDVVKRVDR